MHVPNWINRLIVRLKLNLWLLPAVMALAAVLLATVSVRVDHFVAAEFTDTDIFLLNTPAGARAVLSTIASSMIAVAGTVFSITMVVLSLTSQQHGPLTLRNFLSDRGNQFVLGMFTSTFIYCLLVLRTVRDDGAEVAFVPYTSGIIALILAIISLAVLIYFIHHVSSSIQATSIVERSNQAINQVIDDYYPDPIGVKAAHLDIVTDEENLDAQLNPRSPKTYEIPAKHDGYIQAVDYDRLLALSEDRDLTIKLYHRVGTFVIERSSLGIVCPVEKLDDEFVKAFNKCFTIGRQRTHAQDLAFTMDQLVQMAARALSPAMNDPFTAMMVIDYLGAALARLGSREIHDGYYHREGKLRLIAEEYSYDHLIRIAFDEIRIGAQENPRVTAYLLDTMAMVIECVTNAERRDALNEYTVLIYEQSKERVETHPNIHEVEHAFYRFRDEVLE